MKAKPTYLILAERSPGYWEIQGPLATEHRALKEAEAAAREISARYPQRTFGVYELKAMFGTQQRVIKKRVEAALETKRAAPTTEDFVEPAKIYPIRA